MIQNKIIKWYQLIKRDLPWRETNKPYFIWLSEIIMQQTRVEQGLPYYLRFIEAFPSVKDLAEADEQEVLKLWQGLGYYSRARNLHHASKYVWSELSGVFPASYKDLLKMKGVGPYSAAAIASIAYNEEKAVVDGNVYRVLSRIYEIDTPINSGVGQKTFQNIADKLIKGTKPSLFNQGMMELGALVCKPDKPLCDQCPVHLECSAFSSGNQKLYPVKLKKIKIKNRYFNYLLIEQNGKFHLKKRGAGDIWQGLYDFYLSESTKEGFNLSEFEDQLPISSKQIKSLESFDNRHILTHQHLHIRFFHVVLNDFESHELDFYDVKEISNLPKPKPIDTFFIDYLKKLDIFDDQESKLWQD